MARLSRIKFSDPKEGYYHIMSRTVLKAFLLDKTAKEHFLRLFKKMSRVYFTNIATFTIMSNHFHIIVQMLPSNEISDEELRARFELYYNEGVPKKWHRIFDDKDAEHFRNRLSDVSCFIQDIKQRFSRWYNQLNDGHGHIWAERFKSVILQNEQALLACMVYVELNSVRAGIVERPEEYRYSGLHHMLTGGRASMWLNHHSLASALSFYDTKSSSKNLYKRYIEIVYNEGMIEKPGKAKISEELGNEVLKSKSLDKTIFSFRKRIRYFSDGVILGSKLFCEQKFQEFQPYFHTKKKHREGHLILRNKEKDAADTSELLNLYSIRKFT